MDSLRELLGDSNPMVVANAVAALTELLAEPEGRASMIWIIREYAERIDNANELLESFLVNFHDANIQLQLQLLTAIVVSIVASNFLNLK